MLHERLYISHSHGSERKTKGGFSVLVFSRADVKHGDYSLKFHMTLEAARFGVIGRPSCGTAHMVFSSSLTPVEILSTRMR